MTSDERIERRRAKQRGYQSKYRKQNPEKHRRRVATWQANNREHAREYAKRRYFKKEYGLTIAERDAMLAAQGNACKICGVTQPGSKQGWMVDHCHNSEKVRGILCHGCNLALGFAKDDIKILNKMIEYLGADTSG